MNDLSRLKLNLLSLIRLTRTELDDSLDDLNSNIKKINYYKEKDVIKYESYINQLYIINGIYFKSIIYLNNKLKSCYKDLELLKNIKIPSENFNGVKNSHYLEKINKHQINLERSITQLDESLKIEEKCKKLIDDNRIIVTFSQTKYYEKEVLSNYEKLKQAKIEYYHIKYPEVLVKKYN